MIMITTIIIIIIIIITIIIIMINVKSFLKRHIYGISINSFYK